MEPGNVQPAENAPGRAVWSIEKMKGNKEEPKMSGELNSKISNVKEKTLSQACWLRPIVSALRR